MFPSFSLVPAYIYISLRILVYFCRIKLIVELLNQSWQVLGLGQVLSLGIS